MDKAKGVVLNGSTDGTGKTSVVVRDDRREAKTLSEMGVSKDQSSKGKSRKKMRGIAQGYG